jgi:hypothetical protein
MVASAPWPDGQTLISDLLAERPQTRGVLDRYGLKGCGGPQGPHESLAFFARAHDVPLAGLLDELRSAAVDSHVSPAAVKAGPKSGADAIYRPFFLAGIGVVLSLGAVWGAYLLLRIGLTGSFTAAGLHEVNAHGHAQIFGWVGLFVMGFAYQAFPRFKHVALSHPRLAMATLWWMLGGVVLRSVTQPLGSESLAAWWLAVGASLLEVAATVTFTGVILTTWRASGKSLAHYDGYILAAMLWFVAQAVYESVYLSATLSASGESLLSLVSTWQAPLRDLQIHGFALLMVLGVSQRIFHHFYDLPQPSERLSRAMLPVLNLAVVGEAAGLVLMRTAGHAWAALWYASAAVLAIATVVLVRNWRIFSHTDEADRSLKFLRAAYVWLFVSLAMLVLLPAYLVVLHRFAPWSAAAQLGFSHAYYGAIRHAITVGFVSLMIVGVAAKVVPTLNGLSSRVLSPLWGPFILINLGCALRVCGQILTDFVPLAFPVAGISGLLEVSGLALWGAHLGMVMAGRPRLVRSRVVPAESGRDDGTITAGSIVADVLDRYPTLLDCFLAHGFTTLAQPHFRNTVAKVVTVERACRHVGVDESAFLAELNQRRQTSLSETLPFVPLAALKPVTH